MTAGEAPGSDGRQLAASVLEAVDDRAPSWASVMARIEATAVLDGAVPETASAEVLAELSDPPSVQVAAYLAWRIGDAGQLPLSRWGWQHQIGHLVEARRAGDVETLTSALGGAPVGLADRLLQAQLRESFDGGVGPQRLLRVAAVALGRSPPVSLGDRRIHALQDLFPLAVVAEGLYATLGGPCPIGPTVAMAATSLVRIASSNLGGVADALIGPTLLIAASARAADAIDDQLIGACHWVMRRAEAEGVAGDPAAVGLEQLLAALGTGAVNSSAKPDGAAS